MPLIDREQEVSNKTAPAATPAEAASDTADEDVAPPKPPLPEAKMAELRWGRNTQTHTHYRYFGDMLHPFYLEIQLMDATVLILVLVWSEGKLIVGWNMNINCY